MAITLEQAKAQLNAYLAAEVAALAGQSYTIGNRSLTRANLREIQEGIKEWKKEVRRLERGGLAIKQATPT